MSLLRWLTDYLRMGAFVALVLCGVQIPGFIDQYQDAVSARLSEAERLLIAYQDDADRFTGGDLAALIERYLNNDDAAVVAGGTNLQQLVDRVAYLSQLRDQLSQQYSWQNAWYLVSGGDSELMSEAWQGYDYRVQWDVDALLWGLACAVIGLLMVDLLLALMARFRQPHRRAQ